MIIKDDQLPREWNEALTQGWEIKLASCSCGCNYVWLKPNLNGNFIIAGCICHTKLKIKIDYEEKHNE